METPQEIAQAKQVLHNQVVEIEANAERHLMRTQTDFIGRLCQAYAQVDAVFDEAPEGDLTPEQAQEAYEGYADMAALALAQMAFIRMQHPDPDQPVAAVDRDDPAHINVCPKCGARPDDECTSLASGGIHVE